MKNLFTLILVFFSVLFLKAQVTNDECAGAVNLGTAPVCQNQVFSNIGATPSDIGDNNTPDCFGTAPQNDVWFSFLTGSDLTDYTITVEGIDTDGNPIQGLAAAVYRGFCPANIFALNACATANFGENILTFDVSGLAPNDLYYIRIDNLGGAALQGDFSLCIEKQDTEYTMNDGFSSECSGILYDSGGPNGDYSPNEDLTFTICPEITNSCIAFNLEYYNIEQGFAGTSGDVLTFYNGDNTFAPKILSISGSDIEGINGNGGVCYSVFANECLTVRMTTDNSVNLDGFKATWQCSTSPCEIPESIILNSDANEKSIQNMLSSSLVDIVVTNIDCPNGAWGTFKSNGNDDFGLSEGIVLTTGKAELAAGPNTLNGAGFAHLSDGDDDLDILSQLLGSNLLSNDACVIEVEATVKTDELNFQYIFGSEEYPEYENSTFNDIFALFIEGEGIDGIQELNGKQNLAVLPNTNIPIEIQTVNSLRNWEYFRNNEKGQSVEYDGLVVDYLGSKKSLTASARVVPCNTYKLKFAIADRNDFIFDSGVFISELTNGVPEIALASATGLDFLLEQCSDGQDIIVFQLNTPQPERKAFSISLLGSATEGVDYILELPDSLVFEPNQQIITFPITVLADNITEGTETIEIVLENDYGCDVVNIASLIIEIREELEVEILNGIDTLYACKGMDIELSVTGASNYNWTPADQLNNSTISNPVFINPQETTTFVVTGSVEPFEDESCSDSDTIVVIPIEPSIEIVTDDPTEICFGDEINVRLVNNAGNQGISWVNPDLGILSPDSNFTIIRPTVYSIEPILFIAKLTVAGCEVFDTLELRVDPFEFPQILISDTLLCENEVVQLASATDSEFTKYQWTPSDFLSSDTVPNPFATITEDISYKLVATSYSGICKDSAEINITVKENTVEILPAMDTIFLCLGDSILLNSTSTSNGQGLTWTSNTELVNPNETMVSVKPDFSGYTILTMEFDGCTHIDSVWIQVDSLPDLTFEVIQDKEEYCLGEVITIVFPGFDEENFPNIRFNWDSSPGIVSDLFNMNLAIVADESTTFRRTTTNGACQEITEHEITVLDPSIEIMLADTSILCPFTPVRLTLESEFELEEIMWEPSEGLSCDDCPNPIATVGSTTTFSVTAEAGGCPASASVEVKVADLFLRINFDNPVVCPGTPVQLNLTSNGVVTDIDWSPGNILSCDDCPNPIATSDETVQISVTALVDGCEVNTTGTLVIDESIRNATITVDPDNTVPAGAEITLTVNQQPTFGPNSTFEWFINDNSQGQSENIFVTNQNDTIVTKYSVFIVDENGCYWGATANVIGIVPEFKLPNAFTPNGDENNDVFRLLQVPVSSLDNWELDKFEIYNRWGQLVFSCPDKSCALERGWDGRYNNRNAPAGVYVYAISVILDNGDRINFRGNVTLLR